MSHVGPCNRQFLDKDDLYKHLKSHVNDLEALTPATSLLQPLNPSCVNCDKNRGFTKVHGRYQPYSKCSKFSRCACRRWSTLNRLCFIRFNVVKLIRVQGACIYLGEGVNFITLQTQIPMKHFHMSRNEFMSSFELITGTIFCHPWDLFRDKSIIIWVLRKLFSKDANLIAAAVLTC